MWQAQPNSQAAQLQQQQQVMYNMQQQQTAQTQQQVAALAAATAAAQQQRGGGGMVGTWSQPAAKKGGRKLGASPKVEAPPPSVAGLQKPVRLSSDRLS
jgi:hypothetical protein